MPNPNQVHQIAIAFIQTKARLSGKPSRRIAIATNRA